MKKYSVKRRRRRKTIRKRKVSSRAKSKSKSKSSSSSRAKSKNKKKWKKRAIIGGISLAALLLALGGTTYYKSRTKGKGGGSSPKVKNNQWEKEIRKVQDEGGEIFMSQDKKKNWGTVKPANGLNKGKSGPSILFSNDEDRERRLRNLLHSNLVNA
jgi:hypothetical protein